MVGAVYGQLQRLMTRPRNKHQTAAACRHHTRHFLRIVNELEDSPMPPLQTLAKCCRARTTATIRRLAQGP
jgi:hypothetical protein